MKIRWKNAQMQKPLLADFDSESDLADWLHGQGMEDATDCARALWDEEVDAIHASGMDVERV